MPFCFFFANSLLNMGKFPKYQRYTKEKTPQSATFQYELMYVSYPFYPQVIYSNPLEYALFPNDRLQKVQALKFFLFLINCILL